MEIGLKRTFQIFITFFALLFTINQSIAQNSMTGDGFGGRSWYVAHNYQVGAYSAYTVCGSNKQLYGWGCNKSGELGNGTTISSIVPVAATGMTDVKFYTTGYMTAVIKNDNTAWAWGSLADINFTSGFGNSPTQVLSNVKFADAAIMHTVIVKNDSTVWGIGRNENGALGNGSISPDPVTIPVRMQGINNAVRAIAVGFREQAGSIILLADGKVKITGGGGAFQNISYTLTTPVTMSGLSNIIDIKGCTYGAFALDSSGNVYSFGRNYMPGGGFDWPYLGLGVTSTDIIPPTRMTFPAGAAPIVALSANTDGYSAMALDSNHNVYAWGGNRFGQIGDGTTNDAPRPKLVATNAIDIFSGETFSCILKNDNTLWATGESNPTGLGGYNGSIWMNLPNIQHNVFTQINPLISPMNLCVPVPYGMICDLAVNLGNDTALCDGKKITLDPGIDSAGYLWQDGSVNPALTVDSAGTYSVNVYKRYCSYSDTVNIQYNPLPVVSLGNDTVLCNAEKLTLDVTNNNATYEWQDNSTNPAYNITVAGEYFITVTLKGCKNSDTIIVRSKNCDCNMRIPNAITPNGDGINDRWIISYQNCFQQINVFIYNRYGSLVFQKDNYQNDWEGTYKLKNLPDATYYYVITAVHLNGKKEILNGNLTLLR